MVAMGASMHTLIPRDVGLPGGPPQSSWPARLGRDTPQVSRQQPAEDDFVHMTERLPRAITPKPYHTDDERRSAKEGTKRQQGIRNTREGYVWPWAHMTRHRVHADEVDELIPSLLVPVALRGHGERNHRGRPSNHRTCW